MSSLSNQAVIAGFQSAFTVGPVHVPSPSEGRGNNCNSKFHAQCGAHGIWTLCCLYPGIRLPTKPNSSITTSWYRVATSPQLQKVKGNLYCLPKRQCESIQHFPGAQSPNFDSRVESDFDNADFGWTLSMCSTLYKLCLCYIQGRTLPKLPLRDTEVHGDWSRVFPWGTRVRGWLSEKDPFSKKETHPWRTEKPRHERGSPRHPQESRQICSMKQFCELTLITGWANSVNRGTNFLFNCETTSSMLDPTRSGL